MKKVWKILCFIVLGFVFVTALGFGVMYLWNWLIPEIFTGPTITFWQALGLLLLSKLLFGFPHGHDKGGCKKRKWKERMKHRMEHLTPEEREKMKDHFDRCMGGRWGWKKEEQDPQKEDLV